MTRPFPRIDERAFLAAAVEQHKAGNLEQAKNLYRAILTQNPKHADAIFRLGTMALQVEQFEKAADFIKQAIKIGPATAPMYVNLGAALRNLEQYDEAIAVYDRALKFKINESDVYYNKGRTLQAAERLLEARECYEQALTINDKEADVWINLGLVQKDLDQPNTALHSFETAARLNPDLGAAYSNAAAVLFGRGLFEIAIVLMDKAIELEPDNAKYRFELSNFFLLLGDFEQGWKGFDQRFIYLIEALGAKRPSPPPYWNGEVLKGKKVLLWTEQGIGEEILCASVLPDIQKTGAKCMLQCSDRMVPIFQRSFPWLEVTGWKNHFKTVKETTPPFDFQQPALSMIKEFRPTLDSVAGHAPNLLPDVKLRDKLRKKYEKMAGEKRIIGISWRSRNIKFGDAKTTTLEAWEPILRVENTFFVNLQYGDCTSEIVALNEKLGINIFIDAEIDPLGDLDPVFAQIAAMDMVVSASNSNVHIAASMNIPTWSILPKARGLLWFWFLDREDSPWYPSVRLFRQKSIPAEGEFWWPEVINEVAAALPSYLAKPLAPRTLP
jgi:tetratricopeptide (TPR) repeat protein